MIESLKNIISEKSIAISILQEEINDADYLLENNLSDEAIKEVAHNTTSGSIYDLIDGRVQPRNVPFGQALIELKRGKKIAREGWNGKGMFVVYQKGYPQGIQCNEQTAKAWGMQPGKLFKCGPYLQIKMVNGSHSMWVPSVNDVLAEDWSVVE